jgi:catechol 2,3-dioxygenase-like lactoylglutathione lyase family enzyme
MSRPPFLSFDHVQLAMPAGREDEARAFYAGVLGFVEEPKPEDLRARGGAWFASGPVRLHLGVEPDFRPAKKAHAALLCAGFAGLIERLSGLGVEVVRAGAFEDGSEHAYVSDPFGNRIELVSAERQG